MEGLINLLKKHDLMIIYVNNLWVVTIHKPFIRKENANLSAAVLQVVGKLMHRI